MLMGWKPVQWRVQSAELADSKEEGEDDLRDHRAVEFALDWIASSSDIVAT